MKSKQQTPRSGSPRSARSAGLPLGALGLGSAAGVCLLAALALGPGPACAPPPAPPAEPSTTEWLNGSLEERFQAIEEHLGGFGVAMWEIGYRYGELHFAGQDENWELALHQIEEIREVMELSLVRRPKYAQAAPLLTEPLAAVETAAEAGDLGSFTAAFSRLTAACNTCHLMTDHAFVHVAPPERRQSVLVRPPR